jgi:hypothetical protein
MSTKRPHVVLSALSGEGDVAVPWAVPKPVPKVSDSERKLAMLEQPAIYARLTIRFHELLKSRVPELKYQLDLVNHRTVGLNRLELRATQSLIHRDFKNKTLEEISEIAATWLAEPRTYVVFMNRILNAVEGRPLAKVAQMARELPAFYVERENILAEASANLAKSDTTEFEGILEAMFSVLSARATDEARDRLLIVRRKILELSNPELLAVRGAVWLEIKKKTLAEFTDEAVSDLKDPGLIATRLGKHIDRVATMSDKDVMALAETFPAAMAEIKDSILGVKKMEVNSH